MRVIGAVIQFDSPFAHPDKLELRGDKYRCLKQYLQWWKSYGFDKQHAKNRLIEVTWVCPAIPRSTNEQAIY